jgi:beta-lactamase class A
LDRLDVMLVSAMLTIMSAYALGYRLDWSQDPGLNVSAEEEEDISDTQVPAPAATAPQPETPPPAAKVETAIAPAPGPEWAQSIDEQSWDRMVRDLSSVAARHPGRVAILLKDLKTGRSWTHNPDDLFPAASLIKVPVMIAAFYRIAAGEMALSDRLTLRRRTRVGGSGSLKWRADGTRLTVEELLIHMINESDNTATAMMLDAMGIFYVQQQFPRMGLLYTGIYPEGMSIKGGRVAHENYTTAREMSMLLEKIYRGEAVDKYSSTLMLEILKRRKAVPSRLAKGLPRGWEIAHKPGLLRLACHDTAIFFTPHGDYVMTVLTGQNRNYHDAKDFISRLGRITFRHYTGADQLARSMRRRNQLALR